MPVADPLASVAVVDHIPIPNRNVPGRRRRVLVIGNNLLMVEALVSALAQHGFEPRWAFLRSGAVLQDLVGWRPHVVLLEIDPVDKAAGIELIGLLCQMGVAIAVTCREMDSRVLDECINAGASAVIDTRSSLTDLIAVFRRLTAGDVVIETGSVRNATDLDERYKMARLAPFAALTAREKSVLAELIEGHRVESISKNACVSTSTVRSQIKAILKKLGVNSQLAALAMAHRAGWENDVADPSALPGDREMV